jgi:hypothetical protein
LTSEERSFVNDSDIQYYFDKRSSLLEEIAAHASEEMDLKLVQSNTLDYFNQEFLGLKPSLPDHPLATVLKSKTNAYKNKYAEEEAELLEQLSFSNICSKLMLTPHDIINLPRAKCLELITVYFNLHPDEIYNKKPKEDKKKNAAKRDQHH